MTDLVSPADLPDRAGATESCCGPAAGDDGIDPDDTSVAPAALTHLVMAAQRTHRVLHANGCYPAIMAVGAVEDTVATLARVSSQVRPYVSDYSREGAVALGRVEELLGQARGVLSEARHHLALDLLAEGEATHLVTTASAG